MKKQIFTLLLIVTIIGIVWMNTSSKNERQQYENFIVGELMDYNQSVLQQAQQPKSAEAQNPNSVQADEAKPHQTQYANELKIEKEEKALGQPNIAALQEYYQTMDPVEKRVPQERLIKARQQIKDMKNANTLKNSESMEWEIIPSTMGGRTRSIMWDPNSNSGNRVWAGSVTGGLWYNTDITDPATEWEAVDDFMQSLSVSSLCYDPNNTLTFYAGTGEAETAIITYRESSGRGVGIWKTEDGGYSWSLLESTQDFAYITDIQVKNENGTSVIYAGVASGKYMGADHISQASDGLYRSFDGGESWIQVLPNITDLEIPYTPADIEIGADGRIYIGSMRNIDGNGGATLLFSDDGIEGSWTVNEEYKTTIEAGMGQYSLAGRVKLGAAPSDENIVYAIIGAGYESGFGYYRGNFVLKSTDKGENWNNMNLPNGNEDWASLSWHAFTISVDPNNPEHFYVGGLDQFHSINGGNSYYKVSDWARMYYGGGDDYIHGDQHSIVFKPGSSDEIIFATDGGVFYTNNGSNNYPVCQERNNHYSTLQFYTCNLHPYAISDDCLGGLQDNGTLLYQGDPLDINDMVMGGDGAYCFYDKNEPSITMTSYYYNRYYVYQNGNTVAYVGDNNTGTFISPADYDWNNNILFANGVGFFGQSANTLFRGTGIPNNVSESLIPLGTNINTWFSHVVYSPYSDLGKSTLFVGSMAGHLFKVEDAQATASSTEIGSSDFPTANISCVAIGGSEDTLLVTFSNYGVSSIWQTYDGGNQWQEVEGNLPDMPIRWALYHPQISTQAIVATELGVWFCQDLSLENPIWEPAIDGMANVRVDMLRIRESDNKILAATHGRGLFTTNFEFVPVGIANERDNPSFTVGPNPSNGEFFVEIPGSHQIVKNLSIYNTEGQIVYTKSYKDEKIFVSLRNLFSGTYVLDVKTFNNHYSKKITIQ